jgi:adenylate cyclase 10
VGTAGSRREYSMLGDTVNLAARLMAKAAKEKLKSGIYVDKTTVHYTINKIQYNFKEKVFLKGKSEAVSVYIPDFDVKPTSFDHIPFIMSH